MSRQYTDEEVREKVFDHIKGLIDHYETTPRKNNVRERLIGLAFSILVMFDGESAELPGFIIAPLPGQGDKQYYIDQGSNYFGENQDIKNSIKNNIGGQLHDFFLKDGYK